jgi:threonine synthase
MEYISTRNSSKTFKFKDVFIKGLADDGGLFIPQTLNKFSKDEINSFQNLSYIDLAKKIILPFIGDFMSENELSKIIEKSYSVFREKNVVKLIKVGDRSILELFHGPTLAFKDVAMQLLGNFYEYYLKNENEKINIVVATSGRYRSSSNRCN